ncbi:lycopene cyclase domain-containing protein [Thermospira aquatica]|uniref:Lycopene cyclase domain-containing protein n=1 Tax=Thermospira aquatica TaxID=2828656 RepID=A0AAX3BEU5_9SPIR|nr:lycopene cyclase domain-containing protein [Thermospira aquatica]URA10872.1 lycopene cyclase domain-containing protein [Thermospira aquatica]
MKKWMYVIIPIFAAFVPLVLSFDEKVHFARYWIPYVVSALSVGVVYLVWDVLAVWKGHWRFNDEYVGKWRLFHLPLGEYLFFVCIPYACLFLYEVGVAYFGNDQLLPWEGWWSWLLGGVSIVFAWFMRRRGYTVFALFSAAVFFVLQGMLFPGLLGHTGFLFFLALSTVGFLVVDGLYTSLPTIFYNTTANTNVRLFTIPVEDFVYNISHLGLVLLVYLQVKSWIGL